MYQDLIPRYFARLRVISLYAHPVLTALLVAMTILLVKLYRLLIPRMYRSKCIFRPTCSERVSAILSGDMTTQGIEHALMHLDRCRAHYSIYYDGHVMAMTLSDGTVIYEPHMSAAISMALRQIYKYAFDHFEGHDLGDDGIVIKSGQRHSDPSSVEFVTLTPVQDIAKEMSLLANVTITIKRSHHHFGNKRDVVPHHACYMIIVTVS